MERVKNCPECGEPLAPGVNICPVCQYELTPEEQGLEAGAASPAVPNEPVKPAQAVQPELPDLSELEHMNPFADTPGKPRNQAQGGETTIMSTGAVDNSSHTSDSHNVTDSHDTSIVDNSQTSNTVNNTSNTVNHQTTNVYILGGADTSQLPPQVDRDAVEGAKGVGSIAGGASFQPKPSAKAGNGGISSTLIGSVLGSLLMLGAVGYFVLGGSDEPAGADDVAVPAQAVSAGSSSTAVDDQAVDLPAAQPAAVPKASAVKESQPAAPVDQDFELGMKAFDENDGLTAIKYFEASYAKGNAQAKRMLYTIYMHGCGSVAKNELKAEDYE